VCIEGEVNPESSVIARPLRRSRAADRGKLTTEAAGEKEEGKSQEEAAAAWLGVPVQ